MRTLNLVQQEAYREGVDEAIRVLDAGGLVVLPTETVYGIAARVDHADGFRRLAETKERTGGKPFTLHIGRKDDFEQYVGEPSALARRFIKKGWPGPLTLIVHVADPSRTPIAQRLNGAPLGAIYHDNAVGLRCPDHDVAAAVLSGTSGPVVVASANRPGRRPPITVEHAVEELDDHVDLALDGGRTRYGKPSTIVRVEDHRFHVLREGVLDERMVKGMAQMTLLFVCTGNTCRSPMAQGITERLLAERLSCSAGDLGRHNVRVCSAGTAAVHGQPPAGNAVEVLADKGVDISGLSSQPLSVDLIHQADYIYTMTTSHLETVIDMVPSARDRVTRVLPDQDIADPIGGDQERYRECAHTIEEALKERLKEVEL